MAGWIRSTRAAAGALGLLALALPAHGYIDLAPTLPKIINDSSAIALMEVTAFDGESRVVTLKSVRTLKGAPPADADEWKGKPDKLQQLSPKPGGEG